MPSPLKVGNVPDIWSGRIAGWALASQARCRAQACVAADAKWLAKQFELGRRRPNLPWGVAVEIEPMFSVEAKKRQGQRTDIVADLRQCKAKASD